MDTLPQLFEVDQFDDVYLHLLNNSKLVGYKVKVLEHHDLKGSSTRQSTVKKVEGWRGEI